MNTYNGERAVNLYKFDSFLCFVTFVKLTLGIYRIIDRSLAGIAFLLPMSLLLFFSFFTLCCFVLTLKNQKNIETCIYDSIYLLDMYTLLTHEELSEMRISNDKNLLENRIITDLVRKSRDEGKNLTSNDFLSDMYLDQFMDRNLILYPHGPIVTYGEMPFYYRGQTEDYGKCYSSLFRDLDRNKCSDSEKIRKIFLNQLRINEFNHLINNFVQVKEWSFGPIYKFVIAQHYGFCTDIVDFTDDLDVALFFACCKHNGNNEYLPLDEKDIKKKKYGLLFKRSTLVNTLGILVPDKSSLNKFGLIVLPIGSQPFTRCNRQRGYFVQTKFGEDIQKTNYFKIYKFEHSVKLSEELCHKYDYGKKLFNNDPLSEVSDILEKIKHTKTFSNESFEDTYNELYKDDTQDEWKKILGEYKDSTKNDWEKMLGEYKDSTKNDWEKILGEYEGVLIGEACYKLSNEIIDSINKKW